MDVVDVAFGDALTNHLQFLDVVHRVHFLNFVWPGLTRANVVRRRAG